MSHELRQISGIAPAGPADAAQQSSQDPTAFRRLLEQLEAMATRTTERPAPRDGTELAEALRRADEDFATAMELRRELEAAYRRQQP
ncbi:MAG: hypothetical protein H6837_19165 [Planctomycetes bacterium]|nr:hypothetical protein [Planctomycetota bacterium]